MRFFIVSAICVLFVLAGMLSPVSSSIGGSSKGSRINTCRDFDTVSECQWSADYVVIGSGPGGAPLMRKLSDDYSYSVIGLESGPNFDADPLVVRGENDLTLNGFPYKYGWQFKDVNNKDLLLFRGTGGASAHNGMQATSISQAYARIWQTYGGPRWGPVNVAAVNKEMETYSVNDPLSAPHPNRGSSGPLRIRRPPTGPTSGANSMASRLANYLASSTGLPVTQDYNDPAGTQLGPFPRYQMLQEDDGTRSSAWTAYLPRSVLHENGTSVSNKRQLRVLLESTATKILFQGTKAVAVVFIRNGREQIVKVKKDVIVATSAFTAQLLQVSGVGDAAHLNSIGVPLVAHNAFIGKRTMNHPSVLLPMQVNITESPGLLSNDPAALYAGGAYLPNWDGETHINLTTVEGTREFQIGWFSEFLGPKTLLVFVSHLRTKAVGSTLAQSSDPLRIPSYDNGFLSNPDDVNKFGAFLFAFQKFVDSVHAQDPSYDILWPRWNTVEDAKTFLVTNNQGAYHYAGQTPMSSSPSTGAIDGACKVYGTQNVRVSGASVFPENVDATLSWPSTFVGHNLAKILISERS